MVEVVKALPFFLKVPDNLSLLRALPLHSFLPGTLTLVKTLSSVTDLTLPRYKLNHKEPEFKSRQIDFWPKKILLCLLRNNNERALKNFYHLQYTLQEFCQVGSFSSHFIRPFSLTYNIRFCRSLDTFFSILILQIFFYYVSQINIFIICSSNFSCQTDSQNAGLIHSILNEFIPTKLCHDNWADITYLRD